VGNSDIDLEVAHSFNMVLGTHNVDKRETMELTNTNALDCIEPPLAARCLAGIVAREFELR
jgi:hypothetical protein